MDYSLVRDAVVVGVAYLAVLAVVGIVVALVGGRDPVTYLAGLLTDPIWLVLVVFSLYFPVTSYRRAKRERGDSSG